jgi:hypothetical protein
LGWYFEIIGALHEKTNPFTFFGHFFNLLLHLTNQFVQVTLDVLSLFLTLNSIICSSSHQLVYAYNAREPTDCTCRRRRAGAAAAPRAAAAAMGGLRCMGAMHARRGRRRRRAREGAASRRSCVTAN